MVRGGLRDPVRMGGLGSAVEADEGERLETEFEFERWSECRLGSTRLGLVMMSLRLD